VGVYQEIDTRIDIGNPGEICNGAVIEGAWSQHKAVPTQYSTGVNETYSRRTASRTFMGAENEARTTEGGAASGPKNDDDRCAQRPRGIQRSFREILGIRLYLTSSQLTSQQNTDRIRVTSS
jgi:hypothetical protein